MELNSELDRLQKFMSIEQEMNRQLEKWGMQNHSPRKWMTILIEEVSEVAEGILKAESEVGMISDWKEVIEELVQVQAVAQSMIESIRRNQL